MPTISGFLSQELYRIDGAGSEVNRVAYIKWAGSHFFGESLLQRISKQTGLNRPESAQRGGYIFHAKLRRFGEVYYLHCSTFYRVGICNEHGDCGDCGDCGDGLFLILETLDWGVLCTSEVLCIHWELCCGTCTCITRYSSTVWLGYLYSPTIIWKFTVMVLIICLQQFVIHGPLSLESSDISSTIANCANYHTTFSTTYQ